MELTRSKRFQREYEKLSQRVQRRVDARFLLFMRDPFDRVLENHQLTGPYSGSRSINLSGDLRAIYVESYPDAFHFLEIGRHRELYGK